MINCAYIFIATSNSEILVVIATKKEKATVTLVVSPDDISVIVWRGQVVCLDKL